MGMLGEVGEERVLGGRGKKWRGWHTRRKRRRRAYEEVKVMRGAGRNIEKGCLQE